MISNPVQGIIKENSKNRELINIIILLLSMCMIVLGTLISYGSYGLDYYVKNEFSLAVIIVIIYALSNKLYIKCSNIKPTWAILICFAIISDLVNGRNRFINLISMFMFLMISYELSVKTIKLMIVSIMLAELVFTIQYRLTSFFNSYALATAILGLELLAYIYISKDEKTWRSVIIFCVFFLMLFVMASRTSLVSFAICGLIILLSSLKDKKTNKWITIMLLCVIIAFVIWIYADKLYELLFDKWGSLGYQSSDITAGRFKMWQSIITNHITLWGHSADFMAKTYNHEDAHNIFVQVICKYGILTFIVFVIWLIDIIKRIAKVSAEYRIIFASIFSFYFIAGMTENVLFLDCKSFIITYSFCTYLIWLYKVSDNEMHYKNEIQHKKSKYIK